MFFNFDFGKPKGPQEAPIAIGGDPKVKTAFTAYRRESPKSPRQYGTVYRSTVENLRADFS